MFGSSSQWSAKRAAPSPAFSRASFSGFAVIGQSGLSVILNPERPFQLVISPSAAFSLQASQPGHEPYHGFVWLEEKATRSCICKKKLRWEWRWVQSPLVWWVTSARAVPEELPRGVRAQVHVALGRLFKGSWLQISEEKCQGSTGRLFCPHLYGLLVWNNPFPKTAL